MKFLLTLVAALSIAGAAMAEAPKRPNIVLILADDWGFSDVGAFGGEISTPNLDALAKRGVRFSNFHVTASCAPTRSVMMTGVDHHRNGVGNMPETIPRSHLGKPGYHGVLGTHVVSVANLLRDSGYATSVSGKWHLGHEDYNTPLARGFERSFIQMDSGSDNWEKRPYATLKEHVNFIDDGKETDLPDDFYSSTFFTNKAIQYIKSSHASGKPFFSYIAYQANHIPLQAPRSFIDKYKGKYKDGWKILRQQRREKAIELGLIPKDAPMQVMAQDDWNALSPADKAYEERRMEVYAGMAEAMDHEIGRLISYLKESGQFDNTVFLFTSDNGAEGSDPFAVMAGKLWIDANYSTDIDRLGGKGAYSIIGPSWAAAAVSPLNTFKFWAGEGGIRVPLIISGVSDSQHGKVSTTFASVADIAPTLLALAGVKQTEGTYQGKPVEPMIGESLLPVATGQAKRVHAADKPIFYELSGNVAVYQGEFKLLKNMKPMGDNQWHLYNNEIDPGEVNDLQAKFPEVFKALQEAYSAYAKANGVLEMPEDYDPIAQVQINAFYNYYLPKLRRSVPWILTGLCLLTLCIWYRRRLRAAK
jgi:arylsulfatase A-like enzyme